MAKIPDLRRIVIEEFPDEARPIVEKMGIILNQFMQQTIDALNGNLDSTNLRRDIKSVNVEVDSSGVPKTETLIKSKLASGIKGIIVIQATNLTDSVDLTGAPFVTYAFKNTLMKITHITGLVANKRYSLQIEIIG